MKPQRARAVTVLCLAAAMVLAFWTIGFEFRYLCVARGMPPWAVRLLLGSPDCTDSIDTFGVQPVGDPLSGGEFYGAGPLRLNLVVEWDAANRVRAAHFKIVWW